MPHIFISYSKTDAETAGRLAAKLGKAFESDGIEVWWDRKILPGESWDQVIGTALADAVAVVVLWSETSIKSDFVKEEASRGKGRGALVPVMIEAVQPPLGFGQIEAADLADWDGDPNDPEFKQLVDVLRNRFEAPVPSDLPPTLPDDEASDPVDDKPAEAIDRGDAALEDVAVGPQEEQAADRADPAPNLDPVSPAVDQGGKSAGPIDGPKGGPSTPPTRNWKAYAAVVALLAVTLGATFRGPIYRSTFSHPKEAMVAWNNWQVIQVEDAVSESDLLTRLTTLWDQHGKHAERDFGTETAVEIDGTVKNLQTRVAEAEHTRLTASWDDPDWSSQMLLDSLRHVVDEHGDYLSAEVNRAVGVRISDLEKAVTEYAALRSGRDTLTISQEAEAWQVFVRKVNRHVGEEVATARARIDELTGERRVGLARDEPSLCRAVTDLNCIGAGDIQSSNSVSLWVALDVNRAPATVTFQWRDANGELMRSEDFRATQRSDRYRTFDSFTHRGPGTYEVRLYADDKALLVRKIFQIR